MLRCAPKAIPRCCVTSRTSINEAGHGLLDVWMSHGDKVTEMPSGFKVICANAATPIAGMADEAPPFLRAAIPPRK